MPSVELSELQKMRIYNAAIDLIELLLNPDNADWLKVKGIFRLSVEKPLMDHAMQKIQAGTVTKDIDWDNNIHLRVAVLKQCINMIFAIERTPITDIFANFKLEQFNEAALKEPMYAVLRLVAADDSLKEAVFFKIVQLIQTVASYHEVNKMDASNLAIVFAPNLFSRPTHTPVNLLLDAQLSETSYSTNNVLGFVTYYRDGLLLQTVSCEQAITNFRKKLKQAEQEEEEKFHLVANTLLTTIQTQRFPVQKILFFQGGATRLINDKPVKLPRHIAEIYDAVETYSDDTPGAARELYQRVTSIAQHAQSKPSKGRHATTASFYQDIVEGVDTILKKSVQNVLSI